MFVIMIFKVLNSIFKKKDQPISALENAKKIEQKTIEMRENSIRLFCEEIG